VGSEGISGERGLPRPTWGWPGNRSAYSYSPRDSMGHFCNGMIKNLLLSNL